MSLQAFWQSLQDSPVGDFVASSSWAFPTLESIHVIALTIVLGTVAIMDLRLLGVASTDSRVTVISNDTLRWTWAAFGLAVVSGTLLFMSKATIYTIDPWFLRKMTMMVLAGVNMAVFHVFTWKSVQEWDTDRILPRAARIAGGLSLGIWVFLVFFARLVGFTLGKYE